MCVVKELTKLRLEFNAEIDDGLSPIHMAAGGGHSEVVQSVYDLGIDFKTVSGDFRWL